MSKDTGVNTPVVWLEEMEAESRVWRMQTKLHRWAVADRDRRFDDLYNLVYDPATLQAAFARVAGNLGAGTPGVDGRTVHGLRARAGGVEAFLGEI